MPPATSSYFALSKSPRYSLTFALPLLVLYECLALAIRDATGGIRNGADVLLRQFFALIAGARGPLVFAALLVAVLAAIAVRDVRKHPGTLRPRVFAFMLAESVALALVFGVVVGTITARLVVTAAPLALGPMDRVGWPTALTVSLGAGLYEELLFRVLLVGGLVAAGRRLLGLGATSASVIAVAIGALVFSAFHYVGPYGDTLTVGSFVFRAIAGVAFSGLYVTRGFGIVAWTHALYDIFLMVAR